MNPLFGFGLNLLFLRRFATLLAVVFIFFVCGRKNNASIVFDGQIKGRFKGKALSFFCGARKMMAKPDKGIFLIALVGRAYGFVALDCVVELCHCVLVMWFAGVFV